MNRQTFEITEDFLLNDKPFKIISGAVHYFRIVPEYWRDRLEKLKAMGCNTVEIYIPWNLHEPERGIYNFEGICDIVAFLELIQELGLWAIVRPGPYICSEWEWGGLPYWLLKEEGIRVRSTDERFMDPTRTYYKELLSRMLPLQIDNGGPIILMQVENEYGSYSNETAYVEAIRDLMLECGVTVPLVTSDGDRPHMQLGGTVEGAHPTGNFGSRAPERFASLEKHIKKVRGQGPLMCMEFWVGWFDHWGNEYHSTAPFERNAEDLDYMLAHGHVNFYMYHGGTNFGFMNGSNYYDQLTPDVTSYDYDAPLSEDGRITEKYRAFQEVISKYITLPEVSFSTPITQKAYGTVPVKKKVSLFSTLETISSPQENPWPLSMEQLHQGYGYTLYRSVINKDKNIGEFRLFEANDRALVFWNQEKQLTLYDHELMELYEVDWEVENGATLDILTENMGRVNFGPRLNYQQKGIKGSVVLNNYIQSGWEHWTLPLEWEQLQHIDYTQPYTEGSPAFYQATLTVDELADTYLDMTGWGKGFVLVNDFQLGRFWDIGPQKTLYVPAPLLKKGENIITIFETEGKAQDNVSFTDVHNLGPTQKE